MEGKHRDRREGRFERCERSAHAVLETPLPPVRTENTRSPLSITIAETFRMGIEPVVTPNE
jgi:hypothetical protein